MQGTTRLRRIAEPEQGLDESSLIDTSDQNSIATAQAQAQAQIDAQRKAAGIALQMALRSLSQKSLVALASLFSLLLAGSVFWLFMAVLPNPSVLQLTGLGGYCAFVLALHMVRKRNG